MSKEFLHVAYITDDNYSMPTCVSIVSLLKNKKSDISYCIHIILDNVSQENKERFKQLSYSGCEIDIIEADGDSFYQDFKDGSLRPNTYVSPTALIKFNLPNMFKDVDTLLYLDGDIIVNKDISELFEMDISQFCVAAAPAYSMMPSNHLPQGIKYFSSGVMLLNLKRMRDESITEKLIDYKKNGVNYFMDNDAFCVVLNGQTLFLPLIYNFNAGVFSVNDFDEFVQKCFDGKYSDEYECISDQKILHLQGKWKPWKYWFPWLSEIFIKYYNMSPYKDKPLKLKSALQVILKERMREMNQFKQWKFPRAKIPKGSRIILYGAGEVGREFWDMIKDTHYCEVVLWVDMNYQKLNKDLDNLLHAPEEIKNFPTDYDYILVSFFRFDIKRTVISFLKSMGISEDKIVTI